MSSISLSTGTGINIPIVMGTTGPIPTPPATLLSTLTSTVAETNPGYTADIPGALIEDIASTDVGALTIIDQLRVDLINSLTPLGANLFLLAQLGEIYGVLQGSATNTSVYVTFTGSNGFVINVGFTVSDGTYQYTVQDGGVATSTGVSLYCVATQSGTWAVPANSVTQIVTSVPSGITLSINNPLAGTPGGQPPTPAQYRAAVLQAGLAASVGMPRFLKTLLGNVSGVQPRLVSVIQSEGGGWEVIVGGGDPYQVAYAILCGVTDINTLSGSVLAVSGITQASNGVVTTVLNHGYSTGQIAQINGAEGMTQINGVNITVTVINETSFSTGINTTDYGAYTSGGVLTPNLRNQAVTLNDYPNIYQIPFVTPPQETVTVTVTWNTTSTNSVSNTAMSQAASPALIAYINSIPVGAPINQFELVAAFQAATATILPTALLTRLVFSVNINGVGVSPEEGTGIIAGDPESYLFAAADAITVEQG